MKFLAERVDSFHQRQRQLVECLALGRERDARPRRSKSAVFNSRSSAWICSDTVGWLRNMRSAAFETLPACAAKQKLRNCGKRLPL